jgi:hypothetical protein
MASLEITAAETTGAGPNDAAMAAVADKAAADALAAAGVTDPAAPAERPTWLPEKFKSPEDMAKAYAELEKSQGGAGKKPADPVVPPPVQTDAEKAAAAATAANAAKLETAGLKLDDFNAEYQKDGKLSDASYAKLAAAGIDKGTVDAHIAGQTALATQVGAKMVAAAHEAVGGETEFKALQEWAAKSATPEDLKTYNELVATQDPGKIAAGVRQLAAARDAADGKPPGRTVDGEGGFAGAAAYESWAQVRADMANPKYAADPAFRASVAKRLDATDSATMKS